jgi:serine/threonine protein kinase
LEAVEVTKDSELAAVAKTIPSEETDHSLGRGQNTDRVHATDLETPPEPLAFGQRYHEADLLGEGGMGVVQLCSDRLIGRDVAMKLMHPEIAEEASARQRFLREARLQGRLEHPAVVPVHDLGLTPDGKV